MTKPVGELVDTLIDRLAQAGTPQDLSSQFTFPLSVGVLAELFGVLDADRERLRALLSDAIAQADSPEFGAAMGALVGGIASMVTAKQAQPGEDLITDLAADEDVVTTVVGLLFAGYEPLQERLDAVRLAVPLEELGQRSNALVREQRSYLSLLEHGRVHGRDVPGDKPFEVAIAEPEPVDVRDNGAQPGDDDVARTG